MIIDFYTGKPIAEPNDKSEPKLCYIGVKKQDDSFEFVESNRARLMSYSLDEMIKFVGQDRVDEIFSSYMSGSKDSENTDLLSEPLQSLPLKDGLKTVWDKSEKAETARKARIRELTRTYRAFQALERECSKKHEAKYGEKANIRIKIMDGQNETYLVDAIKKQADILRQDRFSASLSLIGNKTGNAVRNLWDFLTFDE